MYNLSYVKNILQQRDPNYHPELDPNIYDITDWGVHITGEPQRWNTVTVTYTTIDNAYYMRPNTEYQIKMDVIDDKESGKLGVEIVDNPTLINGILSDFVNGYAQTLLTGQYIVLKLNLTDVQDQVICGYPDSISQSIFIENGKVKYFDDINKHDLFDAQTGDLYLKLYSTNRNIEYSLDGENWTTLSFIDNMTAQLDYRISPIHARYLRLIALDDEVGWVAIRDIQINQM